MSLQESNKLIEKFINVSINANERKFSSSAQRLAYERGLLTGLIASLIAKNTYVNFLIRKKIEEDEFRLHKKE